MNCDNCCMMFNCEYADGACWAHTPDSMSDALVAYMLNDEDLPEILV